MQPLKTYEYLERARARVFGWVRPLSPEQYAMAFPIGPGSLARTLTHIMISEWYYIERMMQRNVPAYAQWAIRDENPPAFAELESAWEKQAGRTKAALAAVRDWEEEIEYRVEGDPGEGPLLVGASRGDIFTQLVLHEVHHRAQVMNMLRHLGVKLDDLDYNAIMYRRTKI